MENYYHYVLMLVASFPILVLGWLTLMTMLLAGLPVRKIQALGDFFKKVLPVLPKIGRIPTSLEKDLAAKEIALHTKDNEAA